MTTPITPRPDEALEAHRPRGVRRATGPAPGRPERAPRVCIVSPVVGTASLVLWGVMWGPLALVAPASVYVPTVFWSFLVTILAAALTGLALGLRGIQLTGGGRRPRRPGYGIAKAGVLVAIMSLQHWVIMVVWYTALRG